MNRNNSKSPTEGERNNQLQEKESIITSKLINALPGGISIYEIDDKNVNLLFVNNAYQELLGETSRFCGEDTLDFVYAEDREILQQVIYDIKNGTDKFDVHFRVADIHDNPTWIRLLGSVVERNNTKITVYCCYSDFNDVMNAQNELIKSQAMLDAAMKSAQVFSWRYDYKTNTVTDSGTLGQSLQLPKVIENAPEWLIERGCIHERSIEDFRQLFRELPDGKRIEKDICSIVKGKDKPT